MAVTGWETKEGLTEEGACTLGLRDGEMLSGTRWEGTEAVPLDCVGGNIANTDISDSSKCLTVLTHLSLTTILGGRYHYHLLSTDTENEASE